MGKRITNESFIERSKKFHGDKYDYSKSIYKNKDEKIIITCPINGHGDFVQRAQCHMRGVGCSKCAATRRSITEKKRENFKEKIKKIYGSIYDYSDVIYTGANNKIILKCNNCKISFNVTARHLIEREGCGCPVCVLKKSKNLTTEFFLKKLFIKRLNILEYLKFNEFIYNGNQIKSIVKCIRHGNFKITPNDLLFGYGCSKCGRAKSGRLQTIKIEQIIKFLNENSSLRIIKETYTKIEDKAVFICENCKKEYAVRVSSILYDKIGCSGCKTSKGEGIIKKYLKTNNIFYNEQYTFPDCINILPLRFDFFIPSKNLLIEYDGEFHFEEYYKKQPTIFRNFETVKLRDNIKNEYCLNNNINLLRIPYTEKHNIEKILNGYLGE